MKLWLSTEPDRYRKDKSRGLSLLMVWFPIAVALYVLSTGPAIKIARRTQSAPLSNFLMYVYYPLGTLTDHSPAAEKFFDWYVGSVWDAL